MELIVPSLPVPMIVLAWEHVILQQVHAPAMLDVTEMTVLWFVQTTALEWDLVTMIQAPTQLNAHAMLDVTEMTVPSLPVPMTVLVLEHAILQQDYAYATLDVPEMTVPSLPVRCI